MLFNLTRKLLPVLISVGMAEPDRDYREIIAFDSFAARVAAGVGVFVVLFGAYLVLFPPFDPNTLAVAVCRVGGVLVAASSLAWFHTWYDKGRRASGLRQMAIDRAKLASLPKSGARLKQFDQLVVELYLSRKAR